MRAGASWSTSQHAGASWSTSQHAGASWSTSQHAGASWSTSQHAGASWSTSQHAGASWSTSLVDPLANTRELVDPLVNTPPSKQVFKAVRCHADNSRDVGLLGQPSSWSAWTWIACPLACNQMFQVSLLFQMFQHSTAVTFFFFSTFLLLQGPINMLIATKWSGVWIAICQNDGWPSDFSVTVFKKRSMTYYMKYSVNATPTLQIIVHNCLLYFHFLEYESS